MAFSHRITQSIEVAGESIIGAVSYSGSRLERLDESAPDSATTAFITSLDVSAVKSFYLLSDKAVTFNTNAADASGGQSISLLADTPYVWNTGSRDTFKLTTDVTAVYIVNASGGAARIRMEALLDATP